MQMIPAIGVAVDAHALLTAEAMNERLDALGARRAKEGKRPRGSSGTEHDMQRALERERTRGARVATDVRAAELRLGEPFESGK